MLPSVCTQGEGVSALRGGAEIEEGGVPSGDHASRGAVTVQDRDIGEPRGKEGANFSRGGSAEFGILQPNNCRRTPEQLRQNVIAFV